jgi:pyruvate dehydrogenase E1 component
MRWGFDYMQKDGEGDERGGSIYLRLSTRTVDQVQRELAPELEEAITEGGYWLRRPGPNADVVIAYTGAVAPEAIEATGLLGDERRDIGLLAVTSADRLYRGWSASRRQGDIAPLSAVERLLAAVPRHCGIVTVVDGHPATLAWLGGVCGHRIEALGVDRFGQTGTIDDLYRHYGIDTNSIIAAAERLSRGRAPLRKLAV